MKAWRILNGVIVLFVRMPIWYYLMYSLLKVSAVDRLVWFLFWIYVPLSFFFEIVEKILDKAIREA